jgi:acetoin utilization deacetylase AcuC-like enzyme
MDEFVEHDRHLLLGRQSAIAFYSFQIQPEPLLYPAGFDAHRDDHMAMPRLGESYYVRANGEIKRIAEKYAPGRSALAHVSVLSGW